MVVIAGRRCAAAGMVNPGRNVKKVNSVNTATEKACRPLEAFFMPRILHTSGHNTGTLVVNSLSPSSASAVADGPVLSRPRDHWCILLMLFFEAYGVLREYVGAPDWLLIEEES